MIDLEKGFNPNALNISTVYVVTDGESSCSITKEEYDVLAKYLKHEVINNVVIAKDSCKVRQLIITHTCYCDNMHETNWQEIVPTIT